MQIFKVNRDRRHLTPSQWAMVAARARDAYDTRAKERQKARKGNQPGATPENLPELSKGDARDQAGKDFGVSGRSVDYAEKVLKQGTPELVKAVDEGRMAAIPERFNGPRREQDARGLRREGQAEATAGRNRGWKRPTEKGCGQLSTTYPGQVP